MSIRWQDLPEYEPPPLPSPRHSARALVATNGGFAFATALMVIAQSSGQAGIDPWAKVTAVGLWLFLLGAGWWWSDAVTRSIHLLDGHHPSRARVLRAWTWPLLWIAIAELVILPLDPTEVLDVRPGIAVTGFCLASWRPFSLCRRMLSSLTRVAHDALVISYGVVHITLWYLVWWLVRTPQETDAPISGIAGACVLAAIPAVIGSLALTSAVDHAIAHRILSLRTREEHRYVRSLGLNPFEAKVYLDLVMAKQERERQRGVPMVVDAVRRGLPNQAPSQPTTTTDKTAATDPLPVADVTKPEPRGSPGVDSDAYRREDPEPRGDTGSMPESLETKTAIPSERIVDPTSTRTGDESVEATQGTVSRMSTAGSGKGTPAEAAPRFAVGEDPARSSAVGAEPAARRDSDSDAFEPPRVATLEAARYGVLFALLATATCYVWTTLGALDLTEPITAGRLAQPDVDRLDRARAWTNVALATSLPVQAWWMVAAHVWVRRARTQVTMRLPLALAVGTSLLTLGFLALRAIGASTVPQAVALVFAGAATWAGILRATALARWSEQRPVMVQLWATGVIVVVLVHALTGSVGPIMSATGVEELTLVTVGLGLVTANSAVVAGVFMLSLEDDIRSSSAIARRHEPRR
jgi:hypothetical protein